MESRVHPIVQCIVITFHFAIKTLAVFIVEVVVQSHRFAFSDDNIMASFYFQTEVDERSYAF